MRGIAWDQHEDMPEVKLILNGNTGLNSDAANLSAIIDVERDRELLQACAGRKKRVQVSHGAVLPQERMEANRAIGRVGGAYHLTAGIDAGRIAARIVVEGAEIGHHTLPP